MILHIKVQCGFQWGFEAGSAKCKGFRYRFRAGSGVVPCVSWGWRGGSGDFSVGFSAGSGMVPGSVRGMVVQVKRHGGVQGWFQMVAGWFRVVPPSPQALPAWWAPTWRRPSSAPRRNRCSMRRWIRALPGGQRGKSKVSGWVYGDISWENVGKLFLNQLEYNNISNELVSIVNWYYLVIAVPAHIKYPQYFETPWTDPIH